MQTMVYGTGSEDRIAPIAAATVTDLQKRMDNKPVLKGLSWQIPCGRTIGLLGRNGAGKTTLIECLLGLRSIDAGEILLMGSVPSALTAATKARLGYVPQQSDLFEWMTAEEMLNFMRVHYPVWNQSKVDGLLGRWSIDRKRPIARLSVGEKQRLSIIRALAHDPEFLVLDEPVASLDPAARREFLRELVTTTLERETTVVFSTHILSDLERVAFDLAILHDGRMLLEGALDTVAGEVVRLTGSEPALKPWSSAALAPPRTHGSSVSLIARLSEAEQASITGLQMDRLSLEDMFIEVTE